MHKGRVYLPFGSLSCLGPAVILGPIMFHFTTRKKKGIGFVSLNFKRVTVLRSERMKNITKKYDVVERNIIEWNLNISENFGWRKGRSYKLPHDRSRVIVTFPHSFGGFLLGKKKKLIFSLMEGRGSLMEVEQFLSPYFLITFLLFLRTVFAPALCWPQGRSQKNRAQG